MRNSILVWPIFGPIFPFFGHFPPFPGGSNLLSGHFLSISGLKPAIRNSLGPSNAHSQQRDSARELSLRLSGDSRESANRFAWIGPSKFWRSSTRYPFKDGPWRFWKAHPQNIQNTTEGEILFKYGNIGREKGTKIWRIQEGFTAEPPRNDSGANFQGNDSGFGPKVRVTSQKSELQTKSLSYSGADPQNPNQIAEKRCPNRV